MHTVHKQVGLKSAYVLSLQALIEKYTAQKTLHACITGEVQTTKSSYNINEFAIGHAKASATFVAAADPRPEIVVCLGKPQPRPASAIHSHSRLRSFALAAK